MKTENLLSSKSGTRFQRDVRLLLENGDITYWRYTYFLTTQCGI